MRRRQRTSSPAVIHYATKRLSRSATSAYAGANIDEAVNLGQTKSVEANSLGRSVSEGTSGAQWMSARTSVDLRTSEQRDGAASVPINVSEFVT